MGKEEQVLDPFVCSNFDSNILKVKHCTTLKRVSYTAAEPVIETNIPEDFKKEIIC